MQEYRGIERNVGIRAIWLDVLNAATVVNESIQSRAEKDAASQDDYKDAFEHVNYAPFSSLILGQPINCWLSRATVKLKQH